MQVKSYDEIVRTTSPALVKIDVEGFETEVLKGMGRSLSESNIKAILIETNNAGERYGLKDEDIHSYLKDSGYQPFLYDPFKRELFPFDPTVSNKSNNTVYLKDILACQERLKAAQIFQINGVKF